MLLWGSRLRDGICSHERSAPSTPAAPAAPAATPAAPAAPRLPAPCQTGYQSWSATVLRVMLQLLTATALQLWELSMHTCAACGPAPETARSAPPVLLLGQRGQRRLGGVDEERHVGEGRAGSDLGHQGRSHAVRMVQHEAVGDAAVRLERARLGRQHGDRERHALRNNAHAWLALMALGGRCSYCPVLASTCYPESMRMGNPAW